MLYFALYNQYITNFNLLFKKNIKMNKVEPNIVKEIIFQDEFKNILSFLLDVCEISSAFISYFDGENKLIISEIGFGLIPISDNILNYNKNVIDLKDLIIESKVSKQFSLFIGVPVFNSNNVVVGTICILDKVLDQPNPLQIKIMRHCAQQVQFYIENEKKNIVLENAIFQKTKQFQLFLNTSKEIVLELNKKGIITFVTNNWTYYLGYEGEEVVGKYFTSYIHPEELDLVLLNLKNHSKEDDDEQEITFRILHKKGHFLWFRSILKEFKKDNDFYYLGNCRNVTEQMKDQEEVIKQKEFYEKILDKIPTDVAVFDKNHNYLYLNPFAIKNEELRKFIIGKNDFEYAQHTGRNTVSAEMRREKFLETALTKKLVHWDEKFTSADGTITYHTRKLNPLINKDGNIDIVVGFGVNITEIKEKQVQLIKNRQLLNSIIENVAVGILVQGPDSEILENNKAACEMLGLSQDQLLGKTSYDDLWKVIHLDGTEFKAEDHPVPKAIKELKAVKSITMGVYRPSMNDLVWLLVDAIPVFDNSNKLLYVVCSFNNITELKNIEAELKISNERFIYSSQATSDAIWDWNMITDEILIGKNYTEIFGHTFENNVIMASECDSFVHPDDREFYLQNITFAIENNLNKWSDEYRYLKSDGSYAYVIDKAIIIRDSEGNAIRIIGAMQDVSSKKKLENELLQSEKQFKGAFEQSAAGMTLLNSEGYFIEVNDKLCEILGYSKEEFRSLTFKEITYIEDLEKDLSFLDELNSGTISNYNIEKRYIHKNKSLIWVHLSVGIVKNNDRKITNYIKQIIDISERKKIENDNRVLNEEIIKNRTNQLNEAKNLYRLLADNTVDLICLHNLDTTFQYVSPSVKNLLGYQVEDLVGQKALKYLHPDDFQKFNDKIRNFLDKQQNNPEEFRFKKASGEYVWLEITANIVLENGIPIGFQSNARDITQRNKAKESVEAALLKQRELNELRTNLVATISHEFRTPMTTIRTSAELISLYMGSNSVEKENQMEKRLNTIVTEIDRIIELMNSVLTISKEDSGKTIFNPTIFDLKKLCEDVIQSSFSNEKDKRIVETIFKESDFKVFADKNLMEYCLINLLSNAFKYSEGSGNVLLKLSLRASKIVLEIIDQGIGIPEDDQQKLFNTFYRASNTNGIQGTGLGLYIVKTFTEKNSGKIFLESELNKGTKVTLQFKKEKNDVWQKS